MKTRLRWIPCLLLAVLVVAAAGCRSQDQAAADNTNTGLLTASQAKAALGEVAVGHQLSADGSIAGDQKGNNFTPGQPVNVAFMIGKAPAGTLVALDWFGPNDQPPSPNQHDQKAVTRGESMMNFTKKTSGWGAGDYHVDVSIGGQKVDSERFSIVAPEKAENTATKATDAISDVTVGHQLAADGAIAAGQDGKSFVPGQPVIVSFNSGSAPAGTTIAVAWYGPNDQKLLTDQQQVQGGQSIMHFASNRTSGWGLGDYRIDLLVNGQKADTEHFSIVNENKADKTGR
jgi:hypothetical protein